MPAPGRAPGPRQTGRVSRHGRGPLGPSQAPFQMAGDAPPRLHPVGELPGALAAPPGAFPGSWALCPAQQAAQPVWNVITSENQVSSGWHVGRALHIPAGQRMGMVLQLLFPKACQVGGQGGGLRGPRAGRWVWGGKGCVSRGPSPSGNPWQLFEPAGSTGSRRCAPTCPDA